MVCDADGARPAVVMRRPRSPERGLERNVRRSPILAILAWIWIGAIQSLDHGFRASPLHLDCSDPRFVRQIFSNRILEMGTLSFVGRWLDRGRP